MLTVGLLAAAVIGLAFARLSVRSGWRLALGSAGALMAVSGFDMAFATTSWLVFAAGVTGMLGAYSVDLTVPIPRSRRRC